MEEGEYIAFYYRISGELMAWMAQIEYFATWAIAKHFCKDIYKGEYSKQDELLAILSDKIRSFNDKMEILEDILKRRYNYPVKDLISKLKNLQDDRNRFAHTQVYIPINLSSIANEKEITIIELVRPYPKKKDEIKESYSYPINKHTQNLSDAAEVRDILMHLISNVINP